MEFKPQTYRTGLVLFIDIIFHCTARPLELEPLFVYTELTSYGSSQSQNKLVLLGVVVLSLRFHLFIQRPDEALQGLGSYSQERLKLSLQMEIVQICTR